MGELAGLEISLSFWNYQYKPIVVLENIFNPGHLAMSSKTFNCNRLL